MIQNKSIDELLTILNESEEHSDLEAKSLRGDKMRSVLETVCSFSNEPDLEGGTVLVGVAESRADEGPRFIVEHIDDLDHAQADLATQCKVAFNFPVYPKVTVVKSGKEFVLKVDVKELSASSGLPIKVIREAVVNALMHASYKVGSPIQIIRYPNRIEIRNAGYSLKSPDKLGEPGSVVRNRVIAPVFHETNTAETKGGGIRRMKRLMREAHFAQPTYESDRAANTFVLRLLLHHFLGEADLVWLQKFAGFDLTDAQKTALVFVREVRAIDNQTYRQMAGCDTLKASQDLRKLRDCGLLRQKGSGVSTYYVSSWNKVTDDSLADKGPSLVDKWPSLVDKGPSLVDNDSGLVDSDQHIDVLKKLGKRMSYDEFSLIVCELCKDEYRTKEQLAKLLNRNEGYLKTVLVRMLNDKLLVHKYPEMKNHPGQAYMASKMKGVRHD